MNPTTTWASTTRVLPPAKWLHAFSLVELIAVMAIIVIAIGFAAPAVISLAGAGGVDKAVNDIAAMLEQSRAYAMANNTYVYVGFQEADATTSAASKTQTDGIGRVSVAVIAAKTGVRGYNFNAQAQDSWTSNYNSGANFVIVGKVQQFDGLHLVNLGVRPASGGLMRPPLGTTTAIPADDNIGDPQCAQDCITPFSYPLGNALGSGQYTFDAVIQYDPQGVARVQTAASTDTIVPQIEIGLQQAEGNTVATLTPPVARGNVAAIQISGVTGTSQIYRP